MKNTDQKSENTSKTNSPATDALHKKVVAAEKSTQKAWADYEKKSEAYEEGLKQQSDKITLLGLLAAAKIAKFTYKIKRTEHKLAKANWKVASKADKKSAEKPVKADAKVKKASPEASPDHSDKGKGKKKTAA